MFYKIIPFESKTSRIIIPRHLAYKKSFINGSEITVRAGLKSIAAKLTVSGEIGNSTIKLSEDIIEFLSLPVDIKYQIILKGKLLEIGPVIGLLFARSDNYLTEEALNTCLGYTLYYENFHGLLCLFSMRGIDFDSHTVKGYYYQPSEDSSAGRWKEGTFPFPGAIYRRLSMAPSELEEFKLLTGNKIFNSFYFNKWIFEQLMSSTGKLKRYLPDTCRLSSFDDIKAMLKKYDRVYLKLVSGSLCKGLIEVSKDEGYCFRTTETPCPIILYTDEAAAEYTKHLLEGRKYIVQQGIASLKLRGRVVDFRVVMQKDEACDWKCTAVIGKVGGLNDICSYYGECGGTTTFESALVRTCRLPRRRILLKMFELIIVCTMLCMELDATGENYGDLAIDVALDKDLNIWILEVNKEQDFRILRPVWGGRHCLSVRSNVTRYAVGLTGFKVFL